MNLTSGKITGDHSNPILEDFRRLWVGESDMLEQAAYYAEYELDGDWENEVTHRFTPEQIDHARRVLTKLAALNKED